MRRQFVKEAYQAAISWGLSPAEFWRMSPTEFWWFVEAKMEVKMYGNLSEDDAEDLYQMMQEKGI